MLKHMNAAESQIAFFMQISDLPGDKLLYTSYSRPAAALK